MQYVNFLAFDREENAVRKTPPSVDELTDLTIERTALASDWTSARESLERADRLEQTVEPAHCLNRGTLSDVEVGLLGLAFGVGLYDNSVLHAVRGIRCLRRRADSASRIGRPSPRSMDSSPQRILATASAWSRASSIF